MHNKIWSRGFGAVVLVASLLLSAGQAAADKSTWPKRMTFAAGPSGSFGYVLGSPWTAMISSTLGISMSPEVTRGFAINHMMVEKGQAEVGFGATHVAAMGWDGKAFAKGKKMRNQRILLILTPSILQLYTDADSPINSMSDMAGKSFNPSRAGSGTDRTMRRLLKVLGIKPGRITNLSPPQGNSLLTDGRIDAAAGMGAVPHPALAQYRARKPIKVIGLTEAEQEKFLAVSPGLSKMLVPMGTFKSQKKPLLSIGSYIILVVNKNVPTDLVYAMVKATHDKKGDLMNAHKAFKHLDGKNIVRATIPVHKGAIKYYEEQGIKIPARLKE